MELKVVNMSEVLEGFLADMNTYHVDSVWTNLEEDGEYDRLVAIRKEETLMFAASEYDGASFRIMEAPLEKTVYVASFRDTDDEVEVLSYDSMEAALFSIMEFLNEYREEVKLDSVTRTYTKSYRVDGVEKDEIFAYETKSSLAGKLNRLLA